jgi:glycosyltransferase involved in cell wall biosynthesis
MSLHIDSKQPLVSVIIPTCNLPNSLKDAIASALKQTYQNIEIIVSDDCSQPSPQKLIESFGDPRIRFRRNSKKLGIALNVINAFQEARGKYVASLSDGDIWNEDFLEKLVGHLEANPDLVLAFCDYHIIDSDGKINHAATEENTRCCKRDQLQEGIYQPFYEIGLVHQAVASAVAAVIRRQSIEWHKFLPEMGLFWDLYLTYLACRHGGGAYYCPERLSRYRVSAQSETMIRGQVNTITNIRASKAGVFCYRQFMKDKGLQEFKNHFQEKWLQAHTSVSLDLLRVEEKAEPLPNLLHLLRKHKFDLRI